jgi:hypothetical protein
MEEAPANGKESSHSAHAIGIEYQYFAVGHLLRNCDRFDEQ